VPKGRKVDRKESPLATTGQALAFVAALLAAASVAFAVASFVALLTRPPWAYALAAGQIPLVLAWYSVDGGMAGCLIG
jgi:hypothetical protein